MRIWIFMGTVFRIRTGIDFNADPDPAFYLIADPDPAFFLMPDLNLDHGQTLPSLKIGF
jgi:hypothetical protein